MVPKYGNHQILSHENDAEICKNKELMFYNTHRNVQDIKVIVLLRDPYNWFSSFSKKNDEKKNSQKEKNKKINYFVNLWILYAKSFFVESENIENVFYVNFNKWFLSECYRKKICSFVGLPYSEYGLNRVTSIGSSFNSYEFDGKAQNMELLYRYKYILPKYKKILIKYPEIENLSKKIFDFSCDL